MSVHQDQKGRWFIALRYKDWTGKTIRTTKRGFKSKREAVAWEQSFLLRFTGNLTMTFSDFYTIYRENMQARLRQSTWQTKESIIEAKILPYFRNMRMCDIKPLDILKWQNQMMALRNVHGLPYSPVYRATLHCQLSSIFNHAVRFYDLPSNPAAKAGRMGSKDAEEILVWTKEEYTAFIAAFCEKPSSYHAFQTLYWCGLRLGELLALTPADFDFEHKALHITKSLQRIKGQDVITPPKTPKSVRRILMPQFYADEMKEYLDRHSEIKEADRIFTFGKSSLHYEMTRGCKETGVKRIRIHGIRHSHVSLLMDLGFSAAAIAERVGHEGTDMTYHYAHVFPAAQVALAEKLDQIGRK